MTNTNNTHNAEVNLIHPDISNNARSLARTVDRLPSGTHLIELCKRPGQPWVVVVSEVKAVKKLDR